MLGDLRSVSGKKGSCRPGPGGREGTGRGLRPVTGSKFHRGRWRDCEGLPGQPRKGSEDPAKQGGCQARCRPPGRPVCGLLPGHPPVEFRNPGSSARPVGRFPRRALTDGGEVEGAGSGQGTAQADSGMAVFLALMPGVHSLLGRGVLTTHRPTGPAAPSGQWALPRQLCRTV